MEVAQISQQFSEDTGLCDGQLGFKLLKDLPSAGLAIHLGLESNEVPHVHQEVVMFCAGRQGSSFSKAVTFQALWQNQVVSCTHPGQE